MKNLEIKSLEDIRLNAIDVLSTAIDLNAIKGGGYDGVDDDCDGEIDEDYTDG